MRGVMQTLISLIYIEDEWLEWDWPGEVVVSRYLIDYKPDVVGWVVDPDCPVTKQKLEYLPNLRAIVSASTGINHVDLAACEQRDIPVYCLLDNRYELDRISGSAEWTFWHILSALRNARVALREAETMRWHKHDELMRGNELQGKDVGIIGLGRIGKRIYRWVHAFDARVKHIYDPSVEGTTLEEVFSDCDVVVISCELNEQTKEMITGKLVESMKPGAVLVNTARGEVIRENEVALVLQRRPDIRVGVDVLAGEAIGRHLSSPLYGLRNVTITPHMAGHAKEANRRAARIAYGLLKRAL